jgi:hypothetical protein
MDFHSSIMLLSVSFRPDGVNGLPQTPFFDVGTFPVGFAGLSGDLAQFELQTICHGGPGAARQVIR